MKRLLLSTVALVQRNVALVVLIWLTLAATARTDQPSQERSRFIDNSLLIAPEYPCTWPSHPFPRFAIVHSRKIGPESAYNIDTLLIDVQELIGSTQQAQWPTSPEITAEHVKAFEQQAGNLRAGEVVIFHTGYNDKFLRPLPADTRLWLEPLQGKAEGWPAPGPDAIVYLKSKGIRCVASDAPDLGGVDPKRALMTYWALGGREMVGVEFLVNVKQIPPKRAHFMFAAVKVRDCLGGPGRAIVLY